MNLEDMCANSRVVCVPSEPVRKDLAEHSSQVPMMEVEVASPTSLLCPSAVAKSCERQQVSGPDLCKCVQDPTRSVLPTLALDPNRLQEEAKRISCPEAFRFASVEIAREEEVARYGQ